MSGDIETILQNNVLLQNHQKQRSPNHKFPPHCSSTTMSLCNTFEWRYRNNLTKNVLLFKFKLFIDIKSSKWIMFDRSICETGIVCGKQKNKENENYNKEK